ncbi:hypothetical protein T492DRAFT_1068466 [Pavlovales sp. CCMP2436]|nr:hypothetical protein T492DRAFT_1068466 [Pavlovales sp. CCMP2436]
MWSLLGRRGPAKMWPLFALALLAVAGSCAAFAGSGAQPRLQPALLSRRACPSASSSLDPAGGYDDEEGRRPQLEGRRLQQARVSLDMQLPRLAPGQLAIGMLVGLAWPSVARVGAGLLILAWAAALAIGAARWVLGRRVMAAPLATLLPLLRGWLLRDRGARSATATEYRARPAPQPPPQQQAGSVFLVNLSLGGGAVAAGRERKEGVRERGEVGALDVSLKEAQGRGADFATTGVAAAAAREAAGRSGLPSTSSRSVLPSSLGELSPFPSGLNGRAAPSPPAGAGGSAKGKDLTVPSLAVAYGRARLRSEAPAASAPPLASASAGAAAAAGKAAGAPTLRAGAAVQRAIAQQAAAAAEARSGLRPPSRAPEFSAPAPSPPPPPPPPPPPIALREPSTWQPPLTLPPQPPPPPTPAPAPAPAEEEVAINPRFASRAEQMAYEQMLRRSIAWMPKPTGAPPPSSVVRTSVGTPQPQPLPMPPSPPPLPLPLPLPLPKVGGGLMEQPELLRTPTPPPLPPRQPQSQQPQHDGSS